MKLRSLSSIAAFFAYFEALEIVDAFSSSSNTPMTTFFSAQSSSRFALYSASSSSSADDNDESNGTSTNKNEEENESEAPSPFLSLPPIGESSYGTIASASEKDSTIDEKTGHKQIILNSDKGTEVAQVGSAKFELQYTCNICETRNTHKVSRLAYTKGVVITVCKGCMTKHLIADNLGWSKYWGLGGGFEGKTNIEEYMDDIGKGDEVNRVSKDVYQLEQIYGHKKDEDSSGEQISENDGNAFE